MTLILVLVAITFIWVWVGFIISSIDEYKKGNDLGDFMFSLIYHSVLYLAPAIAMIIKLSNM